MGSSEHHRVSPKPDYSPCPELSPHTSSYPMFSLLEPGTPCKLLVNECWRVVRVWQGLSCSIYNHVDILHSLFWKNTDLNKKSDTVTSGARNQNFLSYMLSLPCQTNHYSPLLKASQILSLESKVKLTNIFPLHLTRGCEM